MAAEDEVRLAKLNRCDDSYYKSAEPIAERLFAFIKANKAAIRRPEATREAPAVIAVGINWQLARDRPGRMG
jgi:hypothetical protein